MDTDTFRLSPVLEGLIPPSSVAMKKIKNLPSERRGPFLIDGDERTLRHYRKNKVQCWKECRSKYYVNQVPEGANLNNIYNYLILSMVKQGVLEVKQDFEFGNLSLTSKLFYDGIVIDQDFKVLFHSDIEYNGVPDLFSWLAMQVPEDIVLFSDKVEAVHLMSPFGWSAEWAIGKDFAEIHEEVLLANKQLVIKDPEKMAERMRKMNSPLERIGAISFRSNSELNCHPDNVKESWKFDKNQQMFTRFERQFIVPFGDFFLFTIKTIYSDCLSQENIESTIQAFQNIDKDAYSRDFILKNLEKILNFLKGKKDE